MSQVICLAGFSNSGKTTSLKYLDPASTFIVSCVNKQLPFPGFKKNYPLFKKQDDTYVGNRIISDNYSYIVKVLRWVNAKMPHIKTIVIDDMNYLMSYATMETATEKGYDKFTIQAKDYSDFIKFATSLREDMYVIFVSHLMNKIDDDRNSTKLFTTGKMLTQTVNLDGLFSYLIYAERLVDDINNSVTYKFRVHTNGYDTCRSAEGVFGEKYIEPNMKYVIDRIEAFNNGDIEPEYFDSTQGDNIPTTQVEENTKPAEEVKKESDDLNFDL